MKKMTLRELVNGLSSGYEVFIRTKEGFEKEARLYRGKSKRSPKEFLLPREEILFVAYESGGDAVIKEANPSRKRAVVGALPCDMQGLDVTAKNFLAQPADPYFKKRMENTLFVSELCQYATASCFCKTFGKGPSARMGDIVYFMLDDENILAEPVTERGKKAIRWERFKDADEEDIKEMESKLAEAEEISQDISLSIDHRREREVYAAQVLKDAVFHCLNCGACTFVCPTCYCFDIRDIKRKDFVIRERVWDSCMYFVYSLEASGHNPRKERAKRAMNRVMHKFFYQPLQYGVYGCTGCGRCIDVCPAGYDIRETVSKVEEYLEGKNG